MASTSDSDEEDPPLPFKQFTVRKYDTDNTSEWPFDAVLDTKGDDRKSGPTHFLLGWSETSEVPDMVYGFYKGQSIKRTKRGGTYQVTWRPSWVTRRNMSETSLELYAESLK
jgi:hypothetical protein